MSLKAKIKYFIKQNPALYSPIKKLHHFQHKSSQKKFRKFGYSVNEQVFRTLGRDFEYYCSAGTLLGIVRENGFIPYDDDLDYLLKISDASIPEFHQRLIAHGFKLAHVYQDKGTVTELSYYSHEVSVDFYRLFEVSSTHDMIHSYYRNPKLYYNDSEVSTTTLNLEKIPAYTIKEINQSHFVLPTNFDAILTAMYGSDWRIPKKGVKGGDLVGDRVNHEDLLGHISYSLR